MAGADIFPFATIWVSSTTMFGVVSGAVPDSVIDGIFQYGLPTLLLAALAWFTFWQEKQRGKRETSAQEERKNQLESLVTELHARNAALDDQMGWMRSQLDSFNAGNTASRFTKRPE